MKALILNSGVGSRMKGLETCKCLIELSESITIIDTQIDALSRCGVKDICITTGPYASELERYVCRNHPHVHTIFVNNPLYDRTNYIFSIQLARELLLNEDILLLHGDLVFEENILQDIIAASGSVMVVDTTKPLPEKDFKAVVRGEKIVRIGVDFFEGATCAQPIYKLTKSDLNLWLDAINRFCAEGKTKVYAENALNEISNTMNLRPLDITGRLCFEVDNNEDLAAARRAFLKMPDRMQKVYAGTGSSKNIFDIVLQAGAKRPFVVCRASKNKAQDLVGDNAVFFTDFTPNPDFADIQVGISLYKAEKCDFIVSIGGGSSIDAAKCINILDNCDNIKVLDMPRSSHLAVPTTAGSGSESTRFSVLYKDNKKLSIEHKFLLPEFAILDSTFLSTLPMYHKKSALLDALCQSMESLWAKGKTPESEAYATSAMRMIFENIEGYLEGKADCSKRVLQASNLAGKAINISKTTAAHAMSYILTSKYGLAHGHAVALCLVQVWKNLLENDNVPDSVGTAIYEEFMNVFHSLQMPNKFKLATDTQEQDILELISNVNAQRLSNHPVLLSKNTLKKMYYRLLHE